MEWQPIESAPRDKIIDIWLEPMIVGYNGYRQTNSKFVKGKWCRYVPIAGWMECDQHYIATHWMPLPRAPKEN